MSDENTNQDMVTNEDLGVNNENTDQNTNAQDSDQTETEAQTQAEELIFGKYKDMDAATDAFKHLESENGKLRREKAPEAPESYEIKVSENEAFKDYADKLSPDVLGEDPHLQAVMPALQKHNITQEAFDDILAAYVQADIDSITNATEKFKSLGDDGANKLRTAQKFISKFPEEEQVAFQSLGLHPEGILPNFSPEGLDLINKLIAMTGEKSVPDTPADRVVEDSAELKAQASKLKKETPNFEYNTEAVAKYERLMDKAAALDVKKTG